MAWLPPSLSSVSLNFSMKTMKRYIFQFCFISSNFQGESKLFLLILRKLLAGACLNGYLSLFSYHRQIRITLFLTSLPSAAFARLSLRHTSHAVLACGEKTQLTSHGSSNRSLSHNIAFGRTCSTPPRLATLAVPAYAARWSRTYIQTDTQTGLTYYIDFKSAFVIYVINQYCWK